MPPRKYPAIYAGKTTRLPTSLLKETNFVEYVKQKEVLFIKDDLKKLNNYGKIDYSKIKIYYKRKLIDYKAMKTLKNSFKSNGKYIKVKEVAQNV